MNKFHLSILYLSILTSINLAQSENTESNSSINGSFTNFTSSNLPIVVINTNGQIIPDDYKITADMGIIYNGDGVRNYLTDPFNNYDGKIGIEVRGSSSQLFPKKQYAFETRDTLGNDLNVSILGFPEESDWILFAPYNDKSLMRDVLVYKIANDMGRYASRSKFCEVVLNGEYVGVYVLLEKVKRDANRVNIKKLEPTDISGDVLTGGYIIKIDKSDGENNDGWHSAYLPFPQSPYSIFYQYHIPKPDEIVQQQKNYIRNKIFQFETMMTFALDISDSATGYPKFLDTDSFVDFFIVNEVAKNVDGYRLSTYLYKDRDSIDPRIFAGPVWDFNLGFGNNNYYNGWLTTDWQLQYLTDYQNIPIDEPFLTPNWWRKLFNDHKFRNKVYERWQNVKIELLNTQKIFSYIDSLTILLDESKTRNFEKWPVLGVWLWPNYFVGLTFAEEIVYLKSWVSDRLNWMNSNMIGEPTKVEDAQSMTPAEFYLEQNYPNPFNPSTKISWQLPAASNVTITIYNSLGKEIETFVNEFMSAGYHSKFFIVEFASPSGIYFYRLKAGGYIQTRKMIYLK